MKSKAEQSRADLISPDQSRAEDKVRARSVTSGQTARTNAEGEKLQRVQLRHAGPGPRGKGRISGDSRAKRSQGCQESLGMADTGGALSSFSHEVPMPSRVVLGRGGSAPSEA